MKTETNSNPRRSAVIEVPSQFCRDLVAAVRELKGRLREKFEGAHPGRSHLIRQALAEAEELAWESMFPQLLLPDFAEARVAAILPARPPAFARAA